MSNNKYPHKDENVIFLLYNSNSNSKKCGFNGNVTDSLMKNKKCQFYSYINKELNKPLIYMFQSRQKKNYSTQLF